MQVSFSRAWHRLRESFYFWGWNETQQKELMEKVDKSDKVMKNVVAAEMVTTHETSIKKLEQQLNKL